MIASPRATPRRGLGWIPGARHAWPRPAPSSSPGHLWIRGQLTPHNPRRLSPCVDRPVDNYTLVFPHLCPQMWMNHRGVLSALSFMAARAARCFSGAVRLVCCLLTSETCGCHDFRDTRSGGNLGQAGGPGGEGGAEGKRSGGAPGRAGVSPGFLRQSPAPPSQVRPHRLLPTICAGSRWSWFDAGPAPSRRESACSTRVGIH